MNLQVCHVVRRFGPVGGMEGYVFNLTIALARCGVTVLILCEQVLVSDDSGVNLPDNLEISVLPKQPKRRARWKGMELFRAAVALEIHSLKLEGYIIHSHERVFGHDVSTQHGPLVTANVSFFKTFLSRRLRMWKKFESEELKASVVLPVSSIVRKEIALCFPQTNIGFLAWPASSPNKGLDVENCLLDASPNKIYALFIGREWKRKGLDRAILIIDMLRRHIRCDIDLDVYGLGDCDVPRRLRKDYVNYKGWRSSIPFKKYVFQLHPARNEPYGMCVAEGLMAGLPVFVSEQTGALDLLEKFPDLKLFKLINIEDERSCAKQIAQTKGVSLSTGCLDGIVSINHLPWSWRELAEKHIKEVYEVVRSVDV